MPTPDEIIQRGEDVRWMRNTGFSDPFMNAVMTKDLIEIEVIRHLIDSNHNVKEIERFCADG